MNKILDKIDFTALRHKEYDLIRDYCDNEGQIRWAVGDMWYDWNQFSKMKKDEVLILKIHKGGTHLFSESKLSHYVDALNPSIYFKITCHDDWSGKPDWESNVYTIEPYEVKEGN